MLNDVLDALVLKAIFDVLRHRIADARLPVFPLRDGPCNDIAIGDRADQAVVLADGQEADILFRHALGDLHQ